MTTQRRIEVHGPTMYGKFHWDLVDDKSNRVIATSEKDYAHQRSAIKAATREVKLYAPGAAVLVVVEL